MGNKKHIEIGWPEQGAEGGVDGDGVQTLAPVKEGVQGGSSSPDRGGWAKWTLRHFVWSHLFGRKDYPENVNSLRAMLELETFRMLDSIPKGTPQSISLEPGAQEDISLLILSNVLFS